MKTTVTKTETVHDNYAHHTDFFFIWNAINSSFPSMLTKIVNLHSASWLKN